jgi:sortase A
VRLRDLTYRFERDPLLKVGVVAMILALGFATVVAFAASLERPMKPAVAKQEVKSDTEPLIRSDPSVDPWVEKDILPTRPEVTSRPPSPSHPHKRPEPKSEPRTRSDASQAEDFRTWQYSSGYAQDGSRQTIPVDETDYPLPTNDQLQATNQSRHYHLPPGAIMSLSVSSIGLNNVPVLNSVTTRALDQGVVHLPDTSFPWSQTPERNVYLAGHRLGWPGTGSHLVFYRLNQLDGGERVTLRDRRGTRYDYRVLESFIVGPEDDWVTGRVRGRDLLTLQTCTPIPTFHKRLIVRAERI